MVKNRDPSAKLTLKDDDMCRHFLLSATEKFFLQIIHQFNLLYTAEILS
jgi:hypothetical protein